MPIVLTEFAKHNNAVTYRSDQPFSFFLSLFGPHKDTEAASESDLEPRYSYVTVVTDSSNSELYAVLSEPYLDRDGSVGSVEDVRLRIIKEGCMWISDMARVPRSQGLDALYQVLANKGFIIQPPVVCTSLKIQ